MTTDPSNAGSPSADAGDAMSRPIGDAASPDKLPTIDAEAAPVSAQSTPLVPSGYDPNAAIRQLEAIIQNLTNYATPVLREIAARAAELAAKAGEAAGPVAHRAAAVTEDVGGRIAAKSREVASDLRGESSDEPGSDG